MGGFVAQFGMLKTARRQTKNMTQIPANWIGQKVVTKYGASVLIENQSSHRPGVRTVFTVKEIDGDRARLVSERANGWIELSEIIVLGQAIEFYTLELLVNPNKAQVHFERGLIWNYLGKADDAIIDLTDAIRLDAGQAYPSHAWRGMAFWAKQNHDKAITDFSEAIRLDPSYHLSFYGRGRVWSDTREYDKAIKDYTQAIQLDPSDPFAFHMRGAAWHDTGEYDKAIEDYTQAIRLDPKSATAFRNRGYACARKKTTRGCSPT